jgi:transposase-like protein/alkylated DNA nucleotide flippase Atl1
MNWYKKSQSKRRTQMNPNSLRNLTPRETQIPKDIQKQIMDMYKAKDEGGQQMSMTAVANHFNLNMGSVRRILNNNNIPIRPRSNLTPSQEQSIFQLYKSPEDGGRGMNYVEIARSIGKPNYANGIMRIVKRLAAEEGYPLRKVPFSKTIMTPEDISKLLHLWDNGEQVTNLRKMFHIQSEEVYQILDENGRDYKRKLGLFNPSPEDADYLLQLLNEGESLSAIADLFGVTTSSISRWLEKGGYREREVSSINKYIDIAPMVGYMYASPDDGGVGMTMEQISQVLNMSMGAVSTALQRANVETRPSAAEPMPFSEEEQRRMVDLYNSGKSITDIAGEMGVSRTPVERVVFRDKGVVPRNQSEAKAAWWKEYFANNPGGFDAYLSQFPELKQQEIRRAIAIKRRRGSQIFASMNWYKNICKAKSKSIEYHFEK